MGDAHRRDVDPAPTEAHGPIFWVGLVAGWAVIGYGIRGVLADASSVRPVDWALWVVGGNLVHDLVVVPVVAVVGVLLARLVRGPWRAPLQAGIVASAVVVAFAWIPVRGYGRRPDDPSALPLDYVTATLTVLAVVWALVAAWLVVAALRRRT